MGGSVKEEAWRVIVKERKRQLAEEGESRVTSESRGLGEAMGEAKEGDRVRASETDYSLAGSRRGGEGLKRRIQPTWIGPRSATLSTGQRVIGRLSEHARLVDTVEILPVSNLIVFDRQRGPQGLWGRFAGRGLRYRAGVLPHSFLSPPAIGRVISIDEGNLLAASEGLGRYLSLMADGVSVIDSSEEAASGTCLFSMVNSARNGFIGEVAEEGVPEIDPRWAKAVATVRYCFDEFVGSAQWKGIPGATNGVDEILGDYGSGTEEDRSDREDEEQGTKIDNSALHSPGSKRIARTAGIRFPQVTVPVSEFGALVGALQQWRSPGSATKRRGHHLEWETWVRYCGSLQELPLNHSDLLKGVPLKDAQNVVAYFASSLREQGENPRQIQGTLRRVCAGFVEAGEVHNSSLLFTTKNNSALNHVMKLCKITVLEHREAVSRRLEKEALPVPTELELATVKKLSNSATWDDTAGLDKLGTCAMGLVSLAFGSRASNIARLGPSNEHYLREEDVSFEVERLGDNGCAETIMCTCGQTLRMALGLEGAGIVSEIAAVDKVVGIRFYFLTSKSSSLQRDGGMATGTYPHWVRRGDASEAHVLATIMFWELNRGAGNPKAPFFCRQKHGATHRPRMVRMEDWVAALQQSAAALGLPPRRFTARSSRVTLATVGQAAGATTAEVNLVGGWATGSTEAASTYAKGPADNLYNLRARGSRVAGVSVEDIKRRLRTRLGSEVK
jgi:hypothetical protein